MLSPISSHNKIKSGRILSFAAVVGVVFLIFIFRLFSIQILNGDSWVAAAVENRLREISLAPTRGVIFDRNGIVLARNVASYNVVVLAADLPDDDGISHTEPPPNPRLASAKATASRRTGRSDGTPD